MNKISTKICALVFFALMHGSLYALDIISAIDITEKEVEAYIRQEYNRSFNCIGDLSVIGGLKLREPIYLRGGFSYGRLGETADIKAFTGAGISPFSWVYIKPMQFSLSYIYNGLPDYEAHAHTILPVISYGVDLAGISYGTGFRFTSFYGEDAQFELINSFSAYLNFINNRMMRMGVIVGNFSDFYAKNFGAYSLKSNAAVNISDNWAVINEIEFLQIGSDCLSADFYGLAWRGGAKYSW